ncbi:MAG: DUF5060 domain-containing protein [Planctomycetota bacterium]
MIAFPQPAALMWLVALLQISIASTIGNSNAEAREQTSSPLVFAEKNGLVAVEAEHFSKQTNRDPRAFYVTDVSKQPNIQPDGDPPHLDDASGGAYLEILPDTRRTHDDKLIVGENFSPQPGQQAVVSYQVHFETPGRYYVWVRAFSTGSEDNGLHVGLNGDWPASGQRLQWCQGKRTWRWDSKQRTKQQHCGEPHKIFLDIPEPGVHTISFSMREDGFEFDKWLMTTNREFERPSDAGPSSVAYSGVIPAAMTTASTAAVATGFNAAETETPKGNDGDGSVSIDGELKTWHKITLDLDGPFANELDTSPNPFVDCRMTVTFKHADGDVITVPGYFAADGNAANTSADKGTTWRAHLAPSKPGQWQYTISFVQAAGAALDESVDAVAVKPYDGQSGSFDVTETDKTGRDLRGHGRLEYVGSHYLRFAGSGDYFMKAGADAPETLLAFADFDNTIARNPKKAPLKTWSPHLGDWQAGDPTWKNGLGKGLIGAINYLSGKGCNAFSFLTYNAGGDGDNVWPFVKRNDKLHYDCSKLGQWGIVFDHGTKLGMYLHFKMQETENDDNTRSNRKEVPESLDGGDLGVERQLYCRELIARFGHNLALNWNLGEENTQTTQQLIAMSDYIADLDPYDHPIVLHTFPSQRDKVYGPLLGDRSQLTGLSLQNDRLATTHAITVKWVEASAKAGKPWVVAFDESGSASHASAPDLGYNGFDGRDRSGKMAHTQHEVRKQTLWATLMGGGVGCEYYFGYKFDENDIVCEDWRSRDQSWDYCRIALDFFRDHDVPFWEMRNLDELIGNPNHEPTNFVFAKPDHVYVVYLSNGGQHALDLSDTNGSYDVQWFNPRVGGDLQDGGTSTVIAGPSVTIGPPPSDVDDDWVVLLRRRAN